MPDQLLKEIFEQMEFLKICTKVWFKFFNKPFIVSLFAKSLLAELQTATQALKALLDVHGFQTLDCLSLQRIPDQVMKMYNLVNSHLNSKKEGFINLVLPKSIPVSKDFHIF